MSNDQKLKILRLSKTVARLKASKLRLSERLGEQAKRGGISAIIYSLNLAHEKGLLSGKSRLLKFIKDIARNLTRKSHRYSDFTKQIYCAVRAIGGPRVAKFIAHNLGGPSDDTQVRTKRSHMFHYYPEHPSERVFYALG